MGQIAWLASYPKSGNTWLRVFLHNYIMQAKAPHSINALMAFSASEAHAAFFRQHDARPASAYANKDVQRMRPLVHRDLTRLHEDLVFIKTHNAALNVQDIPLCTWELTAGAICLIRDPRDVAVSYSAYTGRTVDKIIDFMSRDGAANRSTDTQVFELLGTWSGHVASWLARPNTLVLRYEDLLATPETSFGKIIAFLGDGPPEPERLSHAIAFSNFATLAQQERHEGYIARCPNPAPFFREGKAGQWRDILTPAQARRIEIDHRKIMRRFGYLDG